MPLNWNSLKSGRQSVAAIGPNSNSVSYSIPFGSCSENQACLF